MSYQESAEYSLSLCRYSLNDSTQNEIRTTTKGTGTTAGTREGSENLSGAFKKYYKLKSCKRFLFI